MATEKKEKPLNEYKDGDMVELGRVEGTILQDGKIKIYRARITEELVDVEAIGDELRSIEKGKAKLDRNKERLEEILAFVRKHATKKESI